ncbi:MAG: response regulator transcription factor [Pseudanabaenaceae cyanobacterium SKYGB_i_bin29]|nr:response regulator transcription factor [Pseudanabaenaceae cyanobacterium SKYG29]MDW8420657.1 response regulator transcription factor [Pseudanabaenaceae cyanobacterium SKYGB_i_bin29]
MNKLKILLVEDDTESGEALMEALRDQGYSVEIAADGEEGWEKCTQEKFDLLLLDIMLPKLDGISLCRRLRHKGYTMPVIMLTARKTITDKVLGLDAGADDYMTKPIDLLELFARLRVWERRIFEFTPPPVVQVPAEKPAATIMKWGRLKLNTTTREVTYQQKQVPITRKEFEVLELLIASGRNILTRNAILERLWDQDDPPTEYAVKAHILSIRNKLMSVGAPPDFIETVRGIGYRLRPYTGIN